MGFRRSAQIRQFGAARLRTRSHRHRQWARRAVCPMDKHRARAAFLPRRRDSAAQTVANVRDAG